jgi:DUF1365 family protein
MGSGNSATLRRPLEFYIHRTPDPTNMEILIEISIYLATGVAIVTADRVFSRQELSDSLIIMSILIWPLLIVVGIMILISKIPNILAKAIKSLWKS